MQLKFILINLIFYFAQNTAVVSLKWHNERKQVFTSRVYRTLDVFETLACLHITYEFNIGTISTNQMSR